MVLQEELPKRNMPGKAGASAAAMAAAAETRRRNGIAAPVETAEDKGAAPASAPESEGGGAAAAAAADGEAEAEDEEGSGSDEGDADGAAEEGLPASRRRRRRVAAVARFTVDGVQYQVRPFPHLRSSTLLRTIHRGTVINLLHRLAKISPSSPLICARSRQNPVRFLRRLLSQTENGELEAETLPEGSAARALLAGAGPALVNAVMEAGGKDAGVVGFYEPVLSGVLLMAGGAQRPRMTRLLGWKEDNCCGRGFHSCLTSACWVVPAPLLRGRRRRQAGGAGVPRGEEGSRSAHPPRK